MDTPDTATVTSLISAVGFPIAVAIWLLVRTDSILREVRDLLKQLIAVHTMNPETGRERARN